MPQNAKPAVGDGGFREIKITDWKPHIQNTLREFFSASLPFGMVLHSLMEGAKQYAKLIEFRDRRSADRFRDQILEALDKHLETQ